VGASSGPVRGQGTGLKTRRYKGRVNFIFVGSVLDREWRGVRWGDTTERVVVVVG